MKRLSSAMLLLVSMTACQAMPTAAPVAQPATTRTLTTASEARIRDAAVRTYNVLFTKLDTNGDGRVAKSEQGSAFFRSFDRNGDGVVTKAEYVETQLKGFPQFLASVRMMASLFATVMDLDRDGLVSLAELKKFLADADPVQGPIILQIARDSDTNGSQSLDRGELEAFVAQTMAAGIQMSNAPVIQL